MFPMMMTAAGTHHAGARVRDRRRRRRPAGDRHREAARRQVEAYDVRPAVKEQIQSLGAKFVELPLDTGDAEDKGGYAKAQDEAFYRRQREMMGKVVADERRRDHDRGRPGQESPVLITADMVAGDDAGLGHRRPRRRARRQLRADAAPTRPSWRTASPSSARPTCRRPCRFTPARCTREHRHVRAAPGEERAARVRYGRTRSRATRW